MSPSLPQIVRNVPGFYNGGWGGPEYTDWMDEQLSWKNNCYIGDWSFLWTATFKGPDALSFLRGLTVNSFEDFAVGQAKHVINCNEYGKVVTEGILLRLGEDQFCAQSNPAWWYGFQLEQGHHDAQMTRLDIFNYQVQGPTSIAVIEEACDESVRDVPFMHFKTIHIAGVDVLALRQGMAGEVGFELQGSAADGPKVHAAIMEAGKEHGIRRLGSRTAMINHLEACFPTSAYHFVMAVAGASTQRPTTLTWSSITTCPSCTPPPAAASNRTTSATITSARSSWAGARSPSSTTISWVAEASRGRGGRAETGHRHSRVRHRRRGRRLRVHVRTR